MAAGTTAVSTPETGGMAEWIGKKIKNASDSAKEKREELKDKGQEPSRPGALFAKSMGWEFGGKYIDRFKSIGAQQPVEAQKKEDREKKETEKSFSDILTLNRKLVDIFQRNTDELKKTSADIEIQNSILLKLVTINKQILAVNQEQLDIQRQQLEKAEMDAAEKKLEGSQDAAGTSSIKSPYEEDDKKDENNFLGDVFSNFRRLKDMIKLFSSLGRRGFVRFFRRSGLKLFGKKGLQNLSKFVSSGKNLGAKLLPSLSRVGRFLGSKAMLPLLGAGTVLDTGGQEAAAESYQQKTGVRPGELYHAGDVNPDGTPKEGANPTPQLASGGIVSGSNDNILPLNSSPAKRLLGKKEDIPNISGGRMGEGMGFAQPLADAMMLPFKIAGGGIFGVASTFLNALGPIGGIFKPLLLGPVTSLLEVMGFPSTMIKGLFANGQDPINYFKDIINSSKPKKDKSKPATSSSSSSTTPSTTTPPPSTNPDTDPSNPNRLTADQFAAKQVKETQIKEISGTEKGTVLYQPDSKNLARVRNAEDQTPTEYYHDMLGNLYKVDQKEKKLVRATQNEISEGVESSNLTLKATGQSKLDFFRKPDGNVVVARLNSAPVGSIEIKSRKIVDEKGSARNRVKFLKTPDQEDAKKYNIDQVYSPFGVKLQEGGTGYKLDLDQTRLGMHIKTGETTGDTVEAVLEKGEYIVNRDAVQALGVPFFDRINFDLYPRRIAKKQDTPGRLQKGSYIIGDSIASGMAGRSGANQVKVKDTKGISMVGASPSQVLGFIKEIGKPALKDASVTLSTGATNAYKSGGDLPTVKKQFTFLKDAKAKVSVAGTSTGPNKPPYQPALKQINDSLSAIVKTFGFNFLGGFTSTDGLHPNYSKYGKGAAPASAGDPTSSGQQSAVSQLSPDASPEEKMAAAETDFKAQAESALGSVRGLTAKLFGMPDEVAAGGEDKAETAKPKLGKAATPQSGTAAKVDPKLKTAQKVSQTQVIVATQPIYRQAPQQNIPHSVDYSKTIPYLLT